MREKTDHSFKEVILEHLQAHVLNLMFHKTIHCLTQTLIVVLMINNMITLIKCAEVIISIFILNFVNFHWYRMRTGYLWLFDVRKIHKPGWYFCGLLKMLVRTLPSQQWYTQYKLPLNYSCCVHDCWLAYASYINNHITGSFHWCGQHCASWNLKMGVKIVFLKFKLLQLDGSLPKSANNPHSQLSNNVKVKLNLIIICLKCTYSKRC
jgi:hypothetical protein